MIMGIVAPAAAAPAVALVGSVMNCGIAAAPAPTRDEGAARIGSLVAVVEMICGANTVPPIGRDVGMYVMGNMVGQDWVPAAAISWMFPAAFCVVKMVFPSPATTLVLAGVTWVVAVAAAATVGEAVTGTVETGMAMISGDC